MDYHASVMQREMAKVDYKNVFKWQNNIFKPKNGYHSQTLNGCTYAY
jgi:hypothetical protein